MNTSAKGKRSEMKTERYLEELGYLVHSTRRTARGGDDFFDRFDHIAVKDETVLFIQTKSNTVPPPKERDRIYEFPCKNIFIFIWYDRVPEPRILSKEFRNELGKTISIQ